MCGPKCEFFVESLAMEKPFCCPVAWRRCVPTCFQLRQKVSIFIFHTPQSACDYFADTIQKLNNISPQSHHEPVAR
jgi:hypothetical protein